RWRDIDLDAGRLTIEQSLEQTRAHGIRIKAPKTRKGRRTISLPASTVTELRSHWRTQQEQRLAHGMGRAPADGPVLATFDGKPQSPNAITKAWPRAMAAVGMQGVTLHSLRHTHASMLIAAGVDILTISRRLGHSSPTITLGVYGHLVHGMDDRAAQIMDAALGSKTVAGSPKKTRKIKDNRRSAPNSEFAFPSGQAISRSTYAALFALIGTAYGSGDGSTTFNLPGVGGRLLACRGNRNGAGAGGRITTAGSGIDGATLGAAGGAQSVTLDTTMIPSHSHANSLSDPTHAHGVSDPTHTHAPGGGGTNFVIVGGGGLQIPSG